MSQPVYSKAKAALQNKAIYEYARVNRISYKCALIKESYILSNYYPYLKELEELKKKYFKENQKCAHLDSNQKNETYATLKAGEPIGTLNNKSQVTGFDDEHKKKNVNFVTKNTNKISLKSTQLNKIEKLKTRQEKFKIFMGNLNSEVITSIEKKCNNSNEKNNIKVNSKFNEIIKNKKSQARPKRNSKKESSEVVIDSYRIKKQKILDVSVITKEKKNNINDSNKLRKIESSRKQMSTKKIHLLETDTTETKTDKKKIKHQYFRGDNIIKNENPKPIETQTTSYLKNCKSSKTKKKTEVIQNNVEYDTIFYEDVIISKESPIYIPYINIPESPEVKDQLIDVIIIDDEDIPKPTLLDGNEIVDNNFKYQKQSISKNKENENASQNQNYYNTKIDYNIQDYYKLTEYDQNLAQGQIPKKERESENEQEGNFQKYDYQREKLTTNINEQGLGKLDLNETKLMKSNVAYYPVLHYIVTKGCIESEKPISTNQMNIKDYLYNSNEELTENISLETLIKTFLNRKDQSNNIIMKESPLGKSLDKINFYENKRQTVNYEFPRQENKFRNSDEKNKKTEMPNETELSNKWYNSLEISNVFEKTLSSTNIEEISQTEVFYDDVFQYRPYK